MKYDWRRLTVFKNNYVNRVFNTLNDYPINEASDDYITKIELFWHLFIDEDIAIYMLGIIDPDWKLHHLIDVSIHLDNEAKWLSSYTHLSKMYREKSKS